MPRDTASKEIDAYIAGLAPPFAKAIARLRATIRAAAPEAEEIITYAMPGIGWHGAVVSYRAFKTDCSLFPMGDSVFVGMQDEIAPWRTSKGTLQFKPDAPPPDALIAKIVQTRLAENRARAEDKSAGRRKSRAPQM